MSNTGMIVKELNGRYYFNPIKRKYDETANRIGYTEALNHLTQIMQDSTAEVEKIIQKEIKSGRITDADQTRKSIAGNGFQGLVAYALIANQDNGFLTKEIEITLKPKRHPLINKYAVIKVGDDEQKPDIDLLIYKKEDPENNPIVIFSLKTSLRERVGQTYKWKLLMDIATAENCKTIKNKYQLSYETQVDFKVGLITTNFYEEITNPQQQGMLRFFDYVYITKTGDWENPVTNFSNIIKDLNGLYKT